MTLKFNFEGLDYLGIARHSSDIPKEHKFGIVTCEDTLEVWRAERGYENSLLQLCRNRFETEFDITWIEPSIGDTIDGIDFETKTSLTRLMQELAYHCEDLAFKLAIASTNFQGNKVAWLHFQTAINYLRLADNAFSLSSESLS